MLVIHSKLEKRRELKNNTLFLDREKKEKLEYTDHAKLLGITFSETGTFHKHIADKLKTCSGRVKQLYRFAKHVKGDTLYKVYKTSIEPIIGYGTEILWENFSCNTIKKLNALEFTAIKTSYGLDRQTPTIDCLDYLQEGGIADRLEKRRHNFMENNKDSILIKHAETLKYSEEHKFFSNDFKENIEEEDNDITKENDEEDNDNKKENTNNEKRNIDDKKRKNLNTAQRNSAFQEGNTAKFPTRFPNQEIPHVRFRCRPGHEKGVQFDPG